MNEEDNWSTAVDPMYISVSRIYLYQKQVESHIENQKKKKNPL